MSKEILRDIIEDFSAEKFVNFFRFKNPFFKPTQENLYNYTDEYFTYGEKIGEIKFPDSNFIICAFQVSKELTEKTGKKKQYELGKRILKDTYTDAGIFIFYDQNGNFRFSLIYAEYFGTKRKFSYFKRFTYFVSKEKTNKTFLEQIGEGDFSSLVKIKEAFSIEPVTKQFYEEIQNWYFWAMDKITFPKDYKYSKDEKKDEEIRNATNLIRLITRIIFIWFIKEKKLIPEILFDREKLKKIVNNFGEGNNYYNAILQNLFFATLNSKIDERDWAKNEGFLKNRTNYGVKNLYRYEDKFLISEKEVLELFKEIPFLNGGLFDCLDKEDESGKVIYIDGFSRNPEKQAIIPDYLFFQQEEKRVNLSQYGLGLNKPVRGLIEILKSYNFTIDENTPVDQEVALDPELLGKVFENLLACYNPETATTARKATGSYYTPREIVDYMVDESLKEYFKTQLPEIEENKIELLLSYSEEIPDLTEDEKLKIIYAIDRIKILDPACGSGAFPMGILHKLVYLLQKIDPDNKHWHELQYQKALKASEEIFKEKDKSEREEMLKEINEAFDESINYPDYARKLYLIENCIYGVDIQPIAIQISKLRFFISLVLDQKVDKTKENSGIRPLPNLETKFVAANTLIGLEKPEHIFYTDEIKKLEEEIKKVRHKYFTAKTRTEKLRLQQKDKKLREELRGKLKSIGFSSESSQKISSFDPFDQNASADWFDPEWMFGIVDGFDIVIGNPPYIKEYTNRKAFDGLRDSPYYQGKMDIWYLFACKGIDFLKNKGILTFIAQNNWLTSYGASKMRNKVVEECKILQLLDFGPYFIFGSSDIQTMIMIFQKSLDPKEYSFDLRRIIGKKPVFKDVIDLLNKIPNPNNEYLNPIINRKKYLNKPLTFSKTDIEAILNKIEENGRERLYESEITQGIVIPQDYVIKNHIKKLGQGFKVGDGIFVLSGEEKNNIPFTGKELELIKPYYTSKELKKYYGNKKNSEWIIYTDSRFKEPNAIKHYPNIKKHLDKFQKVITSDNKPYGLHRARDERFFKGEKIIALRKCAEPTFTYTDFDCYVSAAFYVIKTNRFSLKYLTGILNSKLITFWLKHRGKLQGSNFQIDKEPLLNLPLPSLTPQNQPLANQIVQIVDQILSAKKQNPEADTSQLEKEIDRLVYELYDLTEEEIKIIENKK
jgi:hypothetical protein